FCMFWRFFNAICMTYFRIPKAKSGETPAQKKEPRRALVFSGQSDTRRLGSGDVLDRQLDATAVVDVQYQHFNFLAFLEDVGDLLDARIAEHRDVHQTVLARQDVDEGTEINDPLNLADVDLADFGFRSNAQHALTRRFCCFLAFAEDLDRAVIFDVDR